MFVRQSRELPPGQFFAWCDTQKLEWRGTGYNYGCILDTHDIARRTADLERIDGVRFVDRSGYTVDIFGYQPSSDTLMATGYWSGPDPVEPPPEPLLRGQAADAVMQVVERMKQQRE